MRKRDLISRARPRHPPRLDCLWPSIGGTKAAAVSSTRQLSGQIQLRLRGRHPSVLHERPQRFPALAQKDKKGLLQLEPWVRQTSLTRRILLRQRTLGFSFHLKGRRKPSSELTCGSCRYQPEQRVQDRAIKMSVYPPNLGAVPSHHRPLPELKPMCRLDRREPHVSCRPFAPIV